MSQPSLAFIGLGTMGYPMAGHLARAGYPVTVYNRNADKAAKWLSEHGGKTAPTPESAARDADFVFTCVGNDDDLAAVILGENGGENGALYAMAEGAVLVDHTTASAGIARKIGATAQEKGIGFLDAPVSGGEAGAENGALTVMVGGNSDIFDRARPVIDTYARAVTLMGPVGAGQLTKMVNQICVAGLLQGLAEGLAFAKCAGLDGEKVVEVISKGAAGSWQMDNRALTMLKGEFDFGFAIDWMRKDLDICLAESKANGAELPMTEIINKYYKDVQEMGGGRKDTSSLILRLNQKQAGGKE
ncbi:MAG: NAD(P)-dependent oxidoreductase [Rhodospirillaceae bacterium]|nr:NAD(P)-dependent oxidoreductase [Rhodospirillaceae bacterium]